MKVKKFSKNQNDALVLRMSRALRAILLYVARKLVALLLCALRVSCHVSDTVKVISLFKAHCLSAVRKFLSQDHLVLVF